MQAGRYRDDQEVLQGVLRAGRQADVHQADLCVLQEAARTLQISAFRGCDAGRPGNTIADEHETVFAA